MAPTRRTVLMGLTALLPYRAAADDLQLLSGDSSSDTVLGSPFPIRTSDSGRYLVDKFGNPWLMVADSGQCMSRLTTRSSPNASTYITKRASQGFNAIQFDLVSTPYVHNRNTNYANDDGVAPFSSGTSIASTPNAAYWSIMDGYVTLLAQNNMVAILNPIESSTNAGGGQAALAAAGTAGCIAYGTFLGNRYKNSPNVIWHLGNDFDDTTAATHASMAALADAILAADRNHLMTLELNVNDQGDPITAYANAYGQGSFGSIPGMNINSSYDYGATYGEATVAYNPPTTSFGGIAGTNRTPPVPVILLEAHYEGENLAGESGSTVNVRRQAWWLMCAGASGQIYGCARIWGFDRGWLSNLNSPGVSDLQHWAAFFRSIAWQNMVPDQAHMVGTAGYGTAVVGGSFESDTYVPLTASADGTLAVAYFSQGNATSLTVDLAKFTGAVTAKWFDPTNGVYTTILGSPFTNARTHNFSPPGRNNAGDPDWVLLLAT